ncbi:fungal specific transcription factor domain-containing protein [Aspergillus ibericus CBS 121593]|uniref:Zn(2)-C6 fungal-type domain-containing protein n=1 Tax=Aspergillus ibericus CBS 121593 TaxID=1448316 RepID=A0A395GWM0_9EURO|nr:hypothetical protein BO80DRAFT_456230 [Aspergillus ibericus CBS 121593]RAK99822.1 hypothetical protein BO80DRAFT_456230 [Aspergillus ibericus CBS 121593]
MDPAPLTDRRRSCRFCRSRKLRCSGTSVCSACKDRQIECLYDQGGPKGRPRASAARASSRLVAGQPGSEPAMKQASWKSPPSPSGQVFSPRLKSVAEALGEVSAEVQEKLQGRSVEDLARSQAGSPRRAPKLGCRELLMVLTQDLVDATVARFSGLDCLSFFPDQGHCFRQGWTGSSNGAPQALEPAPLAGYNSYRITQLIDVWFGAHPLSMVLSKTLLLRDVRSNAYDPLLLAVLLGSALLELEDAEARVESEQLLQWASSRLQYVSTASADLSTAQALGLLAWHETCQGNILPAMAYSIYANRTVTRLTMDTLARSSRDVRQINGINLVQIELEMMHILGWMTLALMVWSFTHLDIVDDTLPALALMHEHPPMNKDASLVLRLDRAADNLSTLPHQWAWIQEIWTISHITSAAVHLNAIYPRPSSGPASPAPLSQHHSWQTQLHQQLRNIQLYKVDIGNLCSEARAVLARNVQIIEANMEDQVAQTWILTAYRTLLIHLLFPRMAPLSVTADLVQHLADCLLFFARSFPVLVSVSTTQALPRASTQSCIRSYMAGLAACSSAIDALFLVSHKQLPCWEPGVLQGLGRLLEQTTRLDSLFTNDTLLTDWRWRTVQERFHRLSKYKTELSATEPGGMMPIGDGLDEAVLHTL